MIQSPGKPLIRMQDPLKQGLKRIKKGIFEFLDHIRMQDPLKQGLKLRELVELGRADEDSNARSTKTRIETRLLLCLVQESCKFECKIH